MINPSLIAIKLVQDTTTLDAVREFLYDIYINELQWEFNPKNPSGIRIETSKTNKMLVDDRDEQAVWVVAYYENTIIGCVRACERNQKGLFEVQAYNTGKNLDFLNQKQYPSLIELTRGAVHPQFRSIGIFPILIKAAFDYCKNNKLSVFTSPSLAKVINFYRSVGFPDVKDFTFKFEPQDPTEAQLFLANYEKGEVHTVIDNLTRLINNIQTGYVQKSLSLNLAKFGQFKQPMLFAEQSKLSAYPDSNINHANETAILYSKL